VDKKIVLSFRRIPNYDLSAVILAEVDRETEKSEKKDFPLPAAINPDTNGDGYDSLQYDFTFILILTKLAFV
jgi:hypothetical protein